MEGVAGLSEMGQHCPEGSESSTETPRRAELGSDPAVTSSFLNFVGLLMGEQTASITGASCRMAAQLSR